MEILRNHRKSDDNGTAYENIRSMIDYELDNNLIKHKAKDSTTGTRNLLRLHRALEYIVAFLEGVPGLESNDKCCSLSQEAYKGTLMKFHPWVVQKAALMAMHMLPTKEGLIQKIITDQNDQEALDKATGTLKEAVIAMQKVYELTQDLYLEKDLLNLP